MLPGIPGALFIYYSLVFLKACQEHDRCYATCGRTKSECDDAFKKDMLEICGIASPTCRAMAFVYYNGVVKFGDSELLAGSQAYSRLQAKAKEKCCCGQ